MHSFIYISGERYFPPTQAGLSGLEIPSIIWSMPICDDPCLNNERQVLLDMNRSLNGKNWKNKWDLESDNTTYSNSFHCDWYGILCENKTKHVLAVTLLENKLLGQLSIRFNNLQFLLSLHISRNPIYGKFEKVVKTMPKYLLRLACSDTRVSGKIPMQIAKSLPLLSKLQISGSSLSGEIPESIGDLIHLEVLSLGQTKVTGSIPKSISKLTNLWFLDLEILKLKGNLSFLYNLTKLKYLHLLSNEITGEIPENIGESCPNLKELLLPNNKVSGHLPRSISKLDHLEVLNVEKNLLSGLIPRDLCSLHVKVLILSSNNFTGFETGRNCTFNRLDMFMASHLPAFNCSLHTVLSYISGSQATMLQIDLSQSNLYGPLTSGIFSFTRLTSLKLASNKLSGVIPEPGSTMPYLTLLDLQNNDLSGAIPHTFTRLIILTQLNLQRNKKLKGTIVSSILRLDYTMQIKERKSDTCPTVRFAHNNGTVYVDSSYYAKKYCYCDEHYFGKGTHCLPCLGGGVCRGFTSLNQKWNDQVQFPISNMYLKHGYFPFPSALDVKSFRKCPSFGTYTNICAPRKNCRCYFNIKEENIAMLGQNISPINRRVIHCKTSCLCRPGHCGRYCSQCIKGYYKEGIRCYQCPVGPRKGFEIMILFTATTGGILISLGILFVSTKAFKISVILAVIEVVLIFALVMRHLITSVVLQIVMIIFVLGFSSHLQRCTALLKSAISYLQVMDSLVSTTDIWPKSIYTTQVYISSGLNLCFSSLACTFPNFFTLLAKSLLLFLLPFLSIGFLWLAYYLWKLYTKPTKKKLTERNCKYRKYSIVIIDVAYFPIVKSCFSVIVGCREIEGVSFMKRFVWIDCNSSEHISLTVIAILELILYLIAVPFLIYLPLLFRNRKRLLDDSSPNCNWLSPLVAPYKPKYRGYVEVIMLMRRLLIAILMAAFPANSSLQIQCITILLLIAIIFQAVTRPYKDPTTVTSNDEVYDDRLGLENGIDIFMLSCVALSFVCVGLSAGHNRASVPAALFAILFLINALFVVLFCFSILYRLLRPGYSKQDYSISRDLHEPLVAVNEDCYLKESSET